MGRIAGTKWQTFLCFRMRPGPRASRENQEAEDGVHVPAASGAGEAVQAEQVPFQAEEVRSCNESHAHGNSSECQPVRVALNCFLPPPKLGTDKQKPKQTDRSNILGFE